MDGIVFAHAGLDLASLPRRGQGEGGITLPDAGGKALDGDGALGRRRGLAGVVLRVDRGDLELAQF